MYSAYQDTTEFTVPFDVGLMGMELPIGGPSGAIDIQVQEGWFLKGLLCVCVTQNLKTYCFTKLLPRDGTMAYTNGTVNMFLFKQRHPVCIILAHPGWKL